MMNARLAATLALPLVLGGCVSATEYAAKNAGFSSVEAKTAEATGKQTVWVQNQQQARVVSDRVKTLIAKKTIDVETAVQVALLNANYDIAGHYRNNVVPLRTKIEEESLLTYNAMITNAFELLADTRDKVNSILLAVNAKRDFWLAKANLAPAIYGGGAGAASRETEVAAAAESGGGGH